MKKNRVMACLIAGVCVLTVSVTAAFGSINGYANYKTAVKALALDVDNVSAKGTYTLTYDGQEVMNGQVDVGCDGADQYSHSVVTDGISTSEDWSTTLNGVNTWFNSSDDHYYNYEVEAEKAGHGLLNIGSDDEMSQRVFTLLELGADTVVGDLKNNVVEIDAKDGLYTYQLDIDSSQVPAVVNAALSVFAYATSENVANTRYVQWEDWNGSVVRYYEEQTGESLDQDFIDHYFGAVDYASDAESEAWWEANQEQVDKFSEKENEMHEHYYSQLTDELNRRGVDCGVLYVAEDGSTTFYPSEKAYHEAVGMTEVNDFESLIGQDLTLDNVHFTFTVNRDLQLTANHGEASFTTVDDKGGKHTLVLTADATLSDYGTTVVKPLDVGDRQPHDFSDSTVEVKDVEVTEP